MPPDGRAKDEEKEKGLASYLLSLSMSHDWSSFLRLHLLALCCKKAICTYFSKKATMNEGEMMMMIDRDKRTKSWRSRTVRRCSAMFEALESHAKAMQKPCKSHAKAMPVSQWVHHIVFADSWPRHTQVFTLADRFLLPRLARLCEACREDVRQSPMHPMPETQFNIPTLNSKLTHV